MENASPKNEENVDVTDKGTPNKQSGDIEENVGNNLPPKTEDKKADSDLEIREKSQNQNESDEIDKKTPDKGFEYSLEETTSDGEDGMISTIEQARLLLAASKTSKYMNKTPVKQNTQSRKRSVEGSPVSPVKHRRVELITLASPKAKMLKQI